MDYNIYNIYTIYHNIDCNILINHRSWWYSFTNPTTHGCGNNTICHIRLQPHSEKDNQSLLKSQHERISTDVLTLDIR